MASCIAVILAPSNAMDNHATQQQQRRILFTHDPGHYRRAIYRTRTHMCIPEYRVPASAPLPYSVLYRHATVRDGIRIGLAAGRRPHSLLSVQEWKLHTPVDSMKTLPPASQLSNIYYIPVRIYF